MKRIFQRVLLLMLTVVMVVSAAACGGGSSAQESTSTGVASSSVTSADTLAASVDHSQEYTFDVFSQQSNFAGEQTGWYAKVIKDKFNIKMNIIASNLDGGASKFATLMASGDVGDLISFGDNGLNYRNAIKGKLLLDWTQEGLLDKYGKDILANAPKAIEKSKKIFGDGKAVYGIGNEVGDMSGGPSEGATLNFGPELRWDLYKKIGSPQFDKLEDILPVLKKMQEAEPKNAAGKPTYAFSMWSEWDGNMYMNLCTAVAGFFGEDVRGNFLVSSVDNSYHDFLDDAGYYMRVLKFYNKAYQMGLVDPDSMTQKFSDTQSKYRDGRILFSWFPWLGKGEYNKPENTDAGKGFAMVPFKSEKVYSKAMNPEGDNRVWAIGSKAEHPDRIMEFFNWMYTTEGVMLSSNQSPGPKGLTWDVKDGKPALTDFGWKCLKDSKNTQIPAEYGGGNFEDGKCVINNTTLILTAINPDFKEPYDVNLWKSTLEKETDKVILDWRKTTGVLTEKDYFVKNNELALTPFFYTPAMMDKALEQKNSQVGQVIQQYSWKLVFAKDDNEFNTLKAELVSKAKGLGYDEITKWNLENKVLPEVEARKNKK